MTTNLIRVVTLIESKSVTGPARILLEFARRAAHPEPGLPAVHVTIVTYHRGSAENELETSAREAGLGAYSIPERGRIDTSVLAGLRQVVEMLDPDILESRNVKSHFLVRLLGLHKRYPWIAWNHGYTATSRRDRAYNLLDYWSLGGAFRAVTVCGPFAERLVAQGVSRDKITILHNYVKPFERPPEDAVRDARRALGLKESEAVVLCAGRLSHEKGHADLLAATAILTSSAVVPPFRVVIAGHGPEHHALVHQAETSGIADRVVFAGFQRHMAPLFAMASILALPSHSEGSPNVVLEAMAAGLPIAATCVGGVPEILVSGETGLLVPPRDPAAMSEALAKLLSDAELSRRLGQSAQEEALSSYTLESYRRRLVTLYQDTLLAASREKFPVLSLP